MYRVRSYDFFRNKLRFFLKRNKINGFKYNSIQRKSVISVIFNIDVFRVY